MNTTNEDNTAAVARLVKQAVKKYVTGTPRVQSKGGKVRFIMLRADKIDNKLRKMILDVEHPKANVKNMDDIHYANISDRIISAGVDVWIDALGLKEDTNMRSFTQFTEERTFKKGDRVVGRRGNFKGEEAKVVNYDWRLGELTIAVAGKKVRVTPSDWNKIRESFSLDEAQKREFEKGDVVVGRRGNFKGTEAVVVSIDPSGGRIVVSITSKRKVRVDPSDWTKHPTGKRIRESVDELDEARNDTLTITFIFPNNRKAKQFAYDISNSLVATGEVIGNRVEVEPFDFERKTQNAISKYMKKHGGELIDEDAPANSAGSGGVSGFTPDTVGVSKKKQKKHKKQVRKQLGDILMSNEETKTYSTFMEGLEKNIRSWNAGNDRIMVREKDGHPVFIVSKDEFSICKSKRKKFERWSKFFDPKSTNGRKIKEYSHKNPSKPIVLQCSQTGEMIYLRRRLNDSRLKHNKRVVKDD